MGFLDRLAGVPQLEREPGPTRRIIPFVPKPQAATGRAGFNSGQVNIRRFANFAPANVEATTTIIRDARTISGRAKDLALNNPYIVGFMRDIKAQAIHTGIQPRSQHKDKEWRKAINEVWYRSQKQFDANGQLTGYGLQNCWAGAIKISGEIFIRIRYRRPGDTDRNGKKLLVPVQFQTLESDFCPMELNRQEDDGYTRAGIKHNKFGKIEGYWLYSQHPGSDFSNFEALDRTAKLISADQVIHAFEVNGPSQLRGYSGLAAGILPLHDIDQANIAALERQKVCNLISVWLKQAGGVTNPDENPMAGTDQGDGTAIPHLMPGGVGLLPPGIEPIIMDPKESGVNHGEMIKTMLHAAAKSLGIPYDMLSGDLKDVNMSATRHGRETLNAIIDQFREFTMVDQLLDPIWNVWIEQAVLAGAFDNFKKDALAEYLKDPSEFARVEWAQKAHPWIDPEVDGKAAKIMSRSGFKSQEEIVASLGGYIEDVMEQIKRGNDLADSLHIKLDSDGRNVDNGSTQGANPGSGRAAESQLAGANQNSGNQKTVVQ